MTVTAIARFVYLLKKYDSDIKVVSSLTDEYAFRYDTVVLDFDKNFVDRYTGIEISNDRIVATLESLGFKVELNNDNFSVTVPSWRATRMLQSRLTSLKKSPVFTAMTTLKFTQHALPSTP